MPGVPLPPTAAINEHASSSSGLPPIIDSLLSSEALTHLGELRTRLAWVAAALAIAVPSAFFIAPSAVQWLKTIAPDGVGFIQVAPGEVVMMQFKLAIIGGFVFSAPITLFHLLRFLSPGLKSTEKKGLAWMLFGGSLLFIGGTLFSAVWLLPPALQFLIGLGQAVAVTQLSIQSYVDFCLMMLFFCGLMFELPIVLWGMALLGWVTSKQLMTQWRQALVIILVLAAVITPSQDPISLLLLGGVMVALYALSIIPIRLMGR